MSNVQGLFSTTLANPSGYPGQSFFGQNNTRAFMRSSTFVVPPGVSTIRVRVHGAGGSGACTTSTNMNQCATGGAGGGFAMKVIATSPGTSYAVTVGTGGASVASLNNGNAGGTSSFGSILTCTGGAGGLSTSSSIANSAASAAGGTGTGGDVNYSGGASGSATTTTTNVTYRTFAVTGGGSCASIFGAGGASGNASCSAATATASAKAITSGGGVGGSSGNATYTGTTGNAAVATGPGGTAGGSKDLSSSTSSSVSNLPGSGFAYYQATNQPNSNNRPDVMLMPNEMFTSIQGIVATSSTMAPYPSNAVNRFPGDILMGSPIQTITAYIPPGCGGAAANGVTNNYSASVFGGGGAGCDPNNNGSSAGSSQIGGGGGGYSGYVSTDADARSGCGGDGMVIVEW